MPQHFLTLELELNASESDIKSAYRRLARQFHPDLNSSPEAKTKFLAVKEAYEVLSVAEKRANHIQAWEWQNKINRKRDEGRQQSQHQAAEEARRAKEASEKAKWLETKELRAKLATVLNLGKYAEAETIARRLLEINQRDPLAQAALGDVYRSRGDFINASRHYAYAAQFDPDNDLYQRKYEDLMDAAEDSEKAKRIREGTDVNVGPLLVLVFVIITAAVYPFFAQESPLFPELPPVNQLTFGLIGMLALAGVALGGCLSASGALDRIHASLGSATSRISPGVLLAMIAVFNFWLALGLYVLVGMSQGAFQRSVSRLLSGVIAVTVVFTITGMLTSQQLALQTLVWSGNLIYLGAICGWYVADAFRPRSI